jgi:hypothetical protein
MKDGFLKFASTTNNKINMKNYLRILFLQTIFITIISFIYAGNIDPMQAEKVAENKLIKMGKLGQYSIRAQAIPFDDIDHGPLFFVFELSPKGYLVVTADFKLPPVIAYSFTNDFGIDHKDNCLLELLKADVKNRLNNSNLISREILNERSKIWGDILAVDPGTNETQIFEQWPPEGATSTGGWLETNWTQNVPYNNFCPMDPVTNQRSIAGCPAVAMAQIINYYKTINETVFSDIDDYYHSYAGRNYWIDDDFEQIDFPSFETLNAHLDTLANCYSTNGTLKNNEKAALNFACGVAAKQVYTSSISGTFGVDQAYDAFQRFGFIDAVLRDDSDTLLYNILAQHMMEARPVHLAVVDPNWTMGHNLVIDGYNTDDYFHLNFGWGGSYNGWYLLPEEIPYGLTVIEGVITDIAYPPVFTSIEDSDETLLAGSMIIFPNPAENYIFFKLENLPYGNVKVKVYDNVGKLVMDEKISPNGQKIQLNLKAANKELIKPGLYFCTVKSGDQKYSAKFVVK